MAVVGAAEPHLVGRSRPAEIPRGRRFWLSRSSKRRWRRSSSRSERKAAAPSHLFGRPPPPSGLRARFSHSVVDHMRIPDAGPPAHTQGRFRASLSAWRSGRHAHCRRHTHNLGPWPGRVVASIRRTLGACLRQAALLRDWLGIAQRWLGSDGCCPELPATRGGSDSRNAHRSMLPRVTLTVLRLQSCSDLAPGTCHSRALPTCRPCVAYVPTADLPRKLSDFGRHWRQN